jgi:hypothetical protein
MPIEAARPTPQGFSETLPEELRHAPGPTPWSAWMQAQDTSIRQRLELGEEDTLTNLLRFEVTYTNEYQIDRDYLARYGQSTLVNAFAENRADDTTRLNNR